MNTKRWRATLSVAFLAGVVVVLHAVFSEKKADEQNGFEIPVAGIDTVATSAEPRPLAEQVPLPSGSKPALVDSRSSALDAQGRMQWVSGLIRSRPTGPLDESIQLALYDFVLDPDRLAGAGMNRAYEHQLVHNVLAWLRRHAEPDGTLTALLRDLYLDQRQDDVIRDYAIQHLGEWHPRARDKSEVEEVLWLAVSDRAGTIAGTALLALARQVIADDQKSRMRFMDAATDIVRDPTTSVSSRATALRLAGRHGIDDVREDARYWAAHDVAPFLQMAAVRTLGDIGDVADLVFLNDLLESQQRHLHVAAAVSKAKLSRKIGGAP